MIAICKLGMRFTLVFFNIVFRDITTRAKSHQPHINGCLIPIVFLPLLLQADTLGNLSDETPHVPQLKFEHVFEAFADGASPHNHLPLIIQDHDGMMWFAGDNLYRYDGAQLYPYTLDPMSICSSFTTGMAVDHDGGLWLATEKGVCFYHKDTDSFRPFSLPSGQTLSRSAGTVSVSPNNEIYIGFSSELAIINASRTDIKHISSPLKPQYHNRHNEFRSFFFESADSVWIGSLASGLIHFSPSTETFTHFMNTPEQPNLLPSNDVRAVVIDKHGDLWFGMHQGGVSKLLRDRKTFKHYLDSDDSYQLGSPYIWFLKVDSAGQLWLTSDGGGLLGYDYDTDSFFSYKHDANNRNSISSNKPLTVYEDSAKNLWVSLYPEGVDLINRNGADVYQFYANDDDKHSLNDSGILSIFKDANQTVWVATEKGLNRFDQEKKRFDNFSDGSQEWSVPPVPITNINQDRNGHLWLSSWGSSLFRVDLKAKVVSHYKHAEKAGETVDAIRFWQILPEPDRVLFATEGFQGILEYDFVLNKFNRIQLTDGSYAFNETHQYSLLRDSKENLWIGTIGGLFRQTPSAEIRPLSAEKVLNQTMISSFRIRSLFEDKSGGIWVGTEDQGVFLHNSKNEQFQHISRKNGLPSNSVSQIQQSPDGDIWLFTLNGLVRIEHETHKLKIFNKAHGLAGSNFNRTASFIDDDGTLYAGSAKGLSVFKVKQLKTKMQHFPVHITGLKLFNKTITTGDHPGLQHNIIQTESITLGHKDDAFTFSFAGLSYPLSRWNQYAYTLEGYDKAWNYIGKNHSATYTNIPAGKYVFRVKAQDKHGNWSDQQDSMQIIITPAPWLTWWAYLGYLALGVLLLQFAFHLRLQRLKYRKEKLLNTEIIRLNAVRETLRRDFMADISHELRTPLSILTGEVEAVHDGIRPLTMATIESIRGEVTIIKKIVNDLYDLALSDSGVMQCKMKKVDLSEVLAFAVSQMHIKFEQKSIKLDLDITGKDLWVNGDSQRLHQLFLNLLENSFRYTDDAGMLCIKASKNNMHVIVEFSDSSPGVNNAILPEIFKRFYTVDTSRNREHGGSGLGLSICKNIAIIHGATITAKESPLGGIKIDLVFPHYRGTTQ